MEPAQELSTAASKRPWTSRPRNCSSVASMKLLGTMLATTLGWPDYCHAEWAMDDDVLKRLRRHSEEREDLEDKIKKVHTVGYWDKPNNKDIKNWMGVVTPKSIDATTVYPKEQALVDICKLHKAAGHQVWVYCQMTGKRNVQPRLKEILSRAGLKVGIMRADDVEPKEREEWIAKHGREFDVMICFPQLVSTGLDLFSKVQGGHNYNCIVFYETGYKLNMMRQAARRAWRIGQPRDCYIYYLYYQGTMQHRAMSLMSKKMAAALALEGEFSEEGLAAMAGEGDEQMALAKSMSEKIDDADMQRSWSKVKSLTEKKKPAKKKVTSHARRPGCGRQAGRSWTHSTRKHSCSHVLSWNDRRNPSRHQPCPTSSRWPNASLRPTKECGVRQGRWLSAKSRPRLTSRRSWKASPMR